MKKDKPNGVGVRTLLGTFWSITSLAACSPVPDNEPDARARAQMSDAELKALCWKPDRLALQFADERFVMPNRRVAQILSASHGDVISWKDPSSDRHLYCQFPHDVPMPVSVLSLVPPADGGVAAESGRLVGVEFYDKTLTASSLDRPTEYRHTRLEGHERTLADMYDVLTVARDIGKEPGTIYISDRVMFIQAGCIDDPDSITEQDRVAGRTRKCSVRWTEPASPEPRKIEIVAQLGVKPEDQDRLLPVLISQWPRLFQEIQPLE